MGCSRAQGQALSLLLTTEAGLLLFFALYAIWTPHVAHAPSDHLQILLLAVAMGVQAVIGQTISLTTIVFTMTLTKLVGTIADSLANGDALGLKDVNLALEAASEKSMVLPAAQIVRENMLRAIDQGLGDKDWSIVAKLTRRRAGLDGVAGTE